jgi:hypothetical protein
MSDMARSTSSRRQSSGVADTGRAFAHAPLSAAIDATPIRSADGQLDIPKVAELFDLSKAQLADTAGLGRDSLGKATRAASRKTQVRIGELLEILNRVEPWAGGRPQALLWYRGQPIPALDGRTAEALVKSGKAALVRDYLDQIALGGFA